MRTFPIIFSQRDIRWSSQRLGTVDGSNLGEEGCYLVSFCILANYYGHEIAPDALDDLFTENKWYIDGNLLTDAGLQRAYPDCHYVATYPYVTTPADLNQLRDIIADPTASVIIEIDLGGGETHFAVVVDCDGETVTIANPWDGKIENFTQDYGDPKKNILKFVVYKGTPVVTPNSSPTTAGGTASTDPLTACLAMHTTLVQQAQIKDDTITALQKQVKELNDTITNLKKNVSEVSATAATVSSTLQTHLSSDSTAVDAGLEWEQKYNTLLAEVNKLAGQMNTQYPPIQNLSAAFTALETAAKGVQQSPATVSTYQPSPFERFIAYLSGKSVK